MTAIKFFGSQVGGKTATPFSYTGSPIELLRHDLGTFVKNLVYIPYVILPLWPYGSGELCELHPSPKNLLCMFLHGILICMQLPFILSVPFWILFPAWGIVLFITVFMLVSEGICYLLNGREATCASNPKYAEVKEEHKHEQWIFMNGVSVGQHWLQSNVDRLALTFGRPVLGVHNTTNGIVFDLVQCLVQRSLLYSTQDIRSCHSVIKKTLYNPDLTKVIFILHSQGAIEGGMIIDWLLQEIPQHLLAKLEVYTFGNAANHFNNPHLHLSSQNAALSNASAVSLRKIHTQVNSHTTGKSSKPEVDIEVNSKATQGSQSHTPSKTIRYIEHYAHTADFVARFGVLGFTSANPTEATTARFMGRVFERTGKGHMLNQHYLDSMFPLDPAPPNSNGNLRSNPWYAFWKSAPKGGIGGSGYTGAKDTNDFMNGSIRRASPSKPDAHPEGDEDRESLSLSFLSARDLALDAVKDEEVVLRDLSPISLSPVGSMRDFGDGRGFTARNGASENESKGNGDANGDATGNRNRNGRNGHKASTNRSNGGNENDEDEDVFKFRVADLSRLWLYRNGKSPRMEDVAVYGGAKRVRTF